MINRKKTELYLTDLSIAIRKCQSCSYGIKNAIPAGSRIEFNPHVFSSVDYARYMIIYQNPGDAEVAESQAFVGEVGSIFDREIESYNLSRLDFYITSLIKCYMHGDAIPDVKSLAACSPILLLELAAIRPKLIVTLGELVFDFMCPGADYQNALGKAQMSSRDLPFGPYAVFPVCWPDTDESMILFRKHMKILAGAINSAKK